MIDLDYGALEELEVRLVPVLEKRGIVVESLQPIGLLGRGASSSVFSLLINHKYYVLKLYYHHSSFLREMRNRRRLIWPPRLLLTSRQNENPLGYDLVITEVPEGVSFNSTHLLDWVQDRLASHLTELHRLRRKRTVSSSRLAARLSEVEPGALAAADHLGQRAIVADHLALARDLLRQRTSIFRVTTSLLHNDLWWDNIIIAKDDIYLIDWETMTTGDYAEDLAFARIMLDFKPKYDLNRGFWQTPRTPAAADRFFAGIISHYQHDFEDDTLADRLRFYLVLRALHRLSLLADAPDAADRAFIDCLLAELPLWWQGSLTPPTI